MLISLCELHDVSGGFRVWAVVLFPKSTEVELVPHQWLVKSKSGKLLCSWPPLQMKRSEQRKAIESRAEPQEDWTSYDARVLYMTGL